jgi:hypothetical protein
MSEIKVNKVSPRTGTTTTLGDSGDTFTIPSGATITNAGTISNTGTISGAGAVTPTGAVNLTSATVTLNSTMKNTPAFHAYLSSSYEVGNNVVTKLNCNTETYDTDSAYDNSSNYRFTPQVAGKYLVYMNLCGETNAYKLYFMKAKIYKNGSELVSSQNVMGDGAIQRAQESLSFIVDMNGSSDYVEAYGHIDIHANGTEQFLGGSDRRTYFGAYRIIGA